MKIKALLMALAVVLATTTSADSSLPGAKGYALRAAGSLLQSVRVAYNCPHTTCMITVLANYSTCLGNAATAYGQCQSDCADQMHGTEHRCDHHLRGEFCSCLARLW